MKPCHLGLDVGGTNLAAAVFDEGFNMLSHRSIPAGAGRSWQDIVADMAAVSDDAVSAAGVDYAEIECWGIGMPSCINRNTGLLVNAHQFGWKDVPILEWLEGRLPLPVRMDNDANCAALGESLAGAAKGRRNVVMLTLGTGVGSGIILDGKIFSGADGMGAEIGHTFLVPDGRVCNCGHKGCLEAYCSATAIIREAQEKIGLSCRDAESVFSLARQGDGRAVGIIDGFISHLATALASVTAVFRPEVIIIGGGVAEAEWPIFPKINAILPQLAYNGVSTGVPPVVKASLGNVAGLLGAAFL